MTAQDILDAIHAGVEEGKSIAHSIAEFIGEQDETVEVLTRDFTARINELRKIVEDQGKRIENVLDAVEKLKARE
jgi:methyl-accepting chemotaxis protein